MAIWALGSLRRLHQGGCNLREQWGGRGWRGWRSASPPGTNGGWGPERPQLCTGGEGVGYQPDGLIAARSLYRTAHICAAPTGGQSAAETLQGGRTVVSAAPHTPIPPVGGFEMEQLSLKREHLLCPIERFCISKLAASNEIQTISLDTYVCIQYI